MDHPKIVPSQNCYLSLQKGCNYLGLNYKLCHTSPRISRIPELGEFLVAVWCAVCVISSYKSATHHLFGGLFLPHTNLLIYLHANCKYSVNEIRNFQRANIENGATGNPFSLTEKKGDADFLHFPGETSSHDTKLIKWLSSEDAWNLWWDFWSWMRRYIPIRKDGFCIMGILAWEKGSLNFHDKFSIPWIFFGATF